MFSIQINDKLLLGTSYHEIWFGIFIFLFYPLSKNNLLIRFYIFNNFGKIRFISFLFSIDLHLPCIRKVNVLCSCPLIWTSRIIFCLKKQKKNHEGTNDKYYLSNSISQLSFPFKESFFYYKILSDATFFVNFLFSYFLL